MKVVTARECSSGDPACLAAEETEPHEIRCLTSAERPVARRQMDTQQAPTNELFQRMPAYETKLVAHPAAEQANLLALLRHPMTANLARRRAETQSRRAQQHSHRA